MRKVAYIILILLPITIFSQNKWELTHYIYDQHPKSIEVLDSNYINIFFSTGSNFKYIYNSTNQGKTWKLIYATNLYIDDYGMSCPDSNSFFLNFSKGTIFKSLNNGHDIANTFDKRPNGTFERINDNWSIDFRPKIVNGLLTVTGGVTANNQWIIMNSNYDNLRNRIHEIFHTFFYNNDNGATGIHNYVPGTDMPNQDDINNMINNENLPKIRQ